MPSAKAIFLTMMSLAYLRFSLSSSETEAAKQAMAKDAGATIVYLTIRVVFAACFVSWAGLACTSACDIWHARRLAHER
jgi:hypothetical protein